MLIRHSEAHLSLWLVLGVALVGQPREIENENPREKKANEHFLLSYRPKCLSAVAGGSW